MAFPTVVTSTTSSESTDTTSHTVDMPASVASGDLLIAGVAVDGSNTITWPTGWTLIKTVDEGEVTHSTSYRKSDGTEGASIEVESSTSQGSTHFCYRITGNEDPGTQAPEVSTGATGSNNTPDPDVVTVGDARDYMFIATMGSDRSRTITTYPTNYADNNITLQGGTGAATIGAATRELNTATDENPGTYLLSGSEQWGAMTITVWPSAAVSTIKQAFII